MPGTATAGAKLDLAAWRRKRQFFFCVLIRIEESDQSLMPLKYKA
jgi:hypothetical protein